ncbi:group 1 family glycosyl transferase, partial [Klebsiella aerogenes]
LFEPTECRRNAEKFSEERFRTEINTYIRDKWTKFNETK